MTKTGHNNLLDAIRREVASPITWDMLCERVEEEPALLSSSKLEDILEGWEDEHRVMPEAWLRAILDGEEVPQASIAREIQVEECGFSDADLKKLACSPALSTIVSLRMRDNELTDEGLSALTRSLYIESLRRIDLRDNALTFDGVDSILRHPELPRRLHALDISGNEALANEDFHGRLGRSRKLVRLREIGLDDLAFDTSAVRTFAYARVFNRLQSLSMSRNRVDDEAVAYLARSPYLGQLRYLDLSEQQGTKLTNEALLTISASRVLSNLCTLNMSHSMIDDHGVSMLAGTEFMKNLERLDLRGCAVSERACRELIKSENLPSLQVVELTGKSVNHASRQMRAAV